LKRWGSLHRETVRGPESSKPSGEHFQACRQFLALRDEPCFRNREPELIGAIPEQHDAPDREDGPEC